MYLAARIPTKDEAIFDVMVVSGMIDLAHLKALRPELPPAFLYIHENQFAYPMKDGEMRDFRYGITDLMNILCAETVVFNSEFNRATLLEECRNLFSRLPDAVPNWTVMAASGKSRVIYPGIDVESIKTWDDFERVMRPLVSDLNNDGTVNFISTRCRSIILNTV